MQNPTPATSPDEFFTVAVIGAGFGGLGTAAALKKTGIDDFVVFERAADVGGTWQANTYPGAQCDIPSILYSFSFASNPEWSRLYPLQPEIQSYLRTVADRFDITPHIRFSTEVTDASWDDDAGIWVIEAGGRRVRARFLVAALGPFSEPSVPAIPGLATFEGPQFHSARWDHTFDPEGKRIAVIGTGASAVQFIPRLQPNAEQLKVFQRTPTWIMPHPDRPIGGTQRKMFAVAPATQRAARAGFNLVQEALVPGFVYKPALLKAMEAVARAHLRRQIRDPELRAKLTPAYRFGCKRPTFSNAYYPALAAPNTSVITDSITEVGPQWIRTADGGEHEVDAIVFGTGFTMTGHPGLARIHGRDGADLAGHWGSDANAYLGTMVSGFPNMFVLLGPNSALYTSQVVTIEAQVRYLVDAIVSTLAAHADTIDVDPRVQERFIGEVDRKLAGSVWNSGGCSSYYLSPTGRNFTFWPGFAWQFQRRTARVDLRDFRLTRRGHVAIHAGEPLLDRAEEVTR
ncbi:flavin-containing monooxygenase [Nocardia sp. NPDC055321]